MGTPRTAIVTGATSGIGRAFAIELHRQGWDLVLVARDEHALTALAARLGSAEVLTADLASPAGCARVVRRLEDDLRPVGLLVNAAGCGTSHPFPSEDLEAEVRMLELNVVATLRLSHAAGSIFALRGQGGIVNVASTAAVWSVGTYAASKAWVLQAGLGLAAQLRPRGVQATVVLPGFTRTQFHARSSTDATRVRPWLWLEPEQVARESLEALSAGRSLFVPGRRYRLLVALARALPHGARSRLLRWLAPLGPAG